MIGPANPVIGTIALTIGLETAKQCASRLRVFVTMPAAAHFTEPLAALESLSHLCLTIARQLTQPAGSDKASC